MMQTLVEISAVVVLLASTACLVFIVFIYPFIDRIDGRAMYRIMERDVDELIEEKERRYRLEGKYDRLTNELNECALKFAHGSALLRDMQNEHDMSDDLRDQIDGLIRELDCFSSDVNSFIEEQ